MSERLELIRNTLQRALHPVSLEVEDESWKHAGHAGARESGGGHFSVYIVAGCFAGQSRLERHRLVYEALGTQFADIIHALSIHAAAPGEQP
ncbi:MAG: BolA family protein [Mariprofundaceae bacterium]|nr:BolA family protein [Mariprofundaceae bacterium]